MGWDGMGWDGMGDGMGWDGMGWDGMGWDGMGWDATGEPELSKKTPVIWTTDFFKTSYKSRSVYSDMPSSYAIPETVNCITSSTLYFDEISEEEITEAIRHLKPKKSSGPDGIPACAGCFKNTGHNFRSLPSKETLRGHSDSSFRGEGYIQCCVGVRLCDMYSNQELAEIHFMYGKADGNAALARRLYQERYPQRQCPDRKTFVRLHYRLCEYGKFNSPGLGRGRPRSTTPEVQEEILEAVNMTPSISTRRVALQVNVPHTTVWRLLKEYQLYPYHLQRVQALSPADYPAGTS
ncbi:hypothetical protein ANN_09719 [Periplaneta americana]|uniref:DUF4817 domain-containing protein n=1 Tax=Periplaneta americana TaxID=6978 RepID=A0ABQ8TNJ9_PERAM|nr:hypothetical protein ANN_09719 [Periplaneta americana]